jgi:ABC-2 type transport system ATP-binding protein
VLTVSNVEAARVGEQAAQGGFVLHELTPERGSLEEAFMELTRESVEYGGGGSAPLAESQAVVPQPQGETR